jgi:hypothetical protein
MQADRPPDDDVMTFSAESEKRYRELEAKQQRRDAAIIRSLSRRLDAAIEAEDAAVSDRAVIEMWHCLLDGIVTQGAYDRFWARGMEVSRQIEMKKGLI